MNAPIKTGRGTQVRFSGVTKEWLEYQYIQLDRTMREIAAGVGTTSTTVRDWLDKYGLSKPKLELAQRHSRRMSGEGNPAYRGGTCRNYHEHVLLWTGRPIECSWCGTTDDLQVHHIDHDKHNGSADNLTWLCGPCNRLEAQLEALTKEGRASYELTDNRLIVTFGG